MLNRLQAASRLLIRASLALFTAVVLLLIQSAFWTNRVSAWMQVIILATALLSYFRPHYGLLALAALAPLGQVGSRTLDSQMRGAEALVLAFLAGVLMRGWTLREFRTFPSTRLEVAAIIFGFVVAASCAEQLWFLQIQRDFPWPFAQEVLRYASRNYLITFGGYGMLFWAMLLLEGLALLLYAARYSREQPRFAKQLVMMIVAGAAATALLTVGHVVAELLETGDAQTRFIEFLAGHRWSIHVGDVNAAGSFFAMGMFIALGMALATVRHRPAWIATALVLAGTMWMTHSRTAVVAVLLIFAYLIMKALVGPSISVPKTIAVVAGATLTLSVILWKLMPPDYWGTNAAGAIRMRWLFLDATWRMLQSQPVFGVGIGQYALWFHSFAPTQLLDSYQRENAHNNFAQIAGELGLAGLISFIAVLAVSLWPRGADRPHTAILMPVLLALSAFILTWLGGHPLLVPEVSFPFWITLGVVAALVVAEPRMKFPSGLVGCAVIVLLLSIPFRVAAKSTQLDLSRVTYGVSSKQLMTSRARFFVPISESRIEVPIRARDASDDEPVEIDILINGAVSKTLTLRDQSRQTVRIDVSGNSSGRFHQIDLRIKPGELDDIDSSGSSVEVGNWEIISKPNG
jgi:hypothetical protein